MQRATEIIRISSDDWPERDRVPMLREEYGRSLFGLDIEPIRDVRFRSDLRIQLLPGAMITSNVGGGMRVGRTLELVADGKDEFILIINKKGPTVVSQRGRELVLEERAATLSTLSEPGGIFRPTLDQHLLVIHLPRATFAPLVNKADDAIMRPLPTDSAALQLLIKYAGIVHDGNSRLPLLLRRAIADHIHDLAAATIGATRDAMEIARGRGVGAARLSAIKRDILDNLSSRNLSLDAVCARQGITPRYARMLFAAEETTFVDFVQSQRLALARRLLRDPAHAGQLISAIAYECGFGDLSYFNRVFRRRFSATPSDIRAGIAE